MKKIIAVLISVILVFSLCSVAVGATEDTKAEIFRDTFFQFSRAELFDCVGDVKLGEDFPADVVATYTTTMSWKSENNPWLEYVVYEEPDFEDPMVDYYVVPEEVFLAEAQKYFAVDETLFDALKNESIYSFSQNAALKCYNADDKTCIVKPSMGGGATESIYRGYTYSGEEGIYDVYSILVDYVLQLQSVEGLTEWTDYYTERYEGSDDVCYYEVYKVIKSRVKYDGEVVKFLSYEEIEAMPEELINDDSTETKAETEDVKISADKGVFPDKTVLAIQPIKDGEIYNAVRSAYGSDYFKIALYDINARVNGTSVQPDGKVQVTFTIPEGFVPETISLFYFSDDYRTIEQIPVVISADKKTATATLSHFSLYALIDTSAKEDGNGNAGGTTGGATGTTDTTKPTSPQTGANNPTLVLAAVVLALSALGVVLSVKSRKEV